VIESRLPSPGTEPSGSPWDAAFSHYFRTRAHSLRSTAYLMCGDWHHAEDITQAALIKLYLVWPKLDHHDMLDGYARRIVVRTFLAERRRSWRKREQLTDPLPELEAVPVGDTDQRMLIRNALSAVPARQRAVLVLRYWNDLSVEETATTLGCSMGTVKSQCARGLERLRQRLGPHLDGFLQPEKERR
jgi:RNA polymerase sigma-70 factor (sigma-E family)